jgi:hypothetical protein
MKIESGNAWIELRGPDELTGADDDAWHLVYNQVVTDAAVIEPDGDGMEVSADGTSMVPKRRRIRMPPDILQRQRDGLLGLLITGWSYDLQLPYTSASRTSLPLAMCKELDRAIQPHIAVIRDAGPKETASGSSTSTSPDGSGNSPADSTTGPPNTASSSPATA